MSTTAPTSGSAEAQSGEPTRFKRAMALLAMTLVPGTAQIAAGDKRVGRAAWRTLLLLLLLLVALIIGVFAARAQTVNFLSRPSVLLVIEIAIVLVALGWLYLFIDAFRLGHFKRLTTSHRSIAGVLGVALTFLVVGSLAFSASLVNTQRGLMASVFSGKKTTKATGGRYNILLMGGDAGKGRTGLRPDSMNVVSIDENTGRAVIIGLPRNMQRFTFTPGSEMAKHFPKGFKNCGWSECMLNGVSTWADDHKKYFPGDKHPGYTATISAIENITGLKINYYVIVDLWGFKRLIDAVGGVRLTVTKPVPVGGIGSPIVRYIKPGNNKRLNGEDALWFARSRVGSSDYERMARQRCVMSAMLKQLDPATVLTKFNAIASAGKQIVQTSIPSGQVGTFVDLALKAKSKPISSFSPTPPLINTSHPDMNKIRRHVALAIAKSRSLDGGPKVAAPATRSTAAKGSAASSATSKSSESASPTRSGGSPSDSKNNNPLHPNANETDVAKVCSVA